jgi:hypothetical protein
MKLLPALILYPLALSTFAQSPQNPQVPTLERLCGKLQHEEYRLRPGTTNVSDVARWDLRHVVVNLYPAVENAQCCEGTIVAATTVTGHWGSFDLKTKRLQGGPYWLEVRPDGHSYSILVRYAPKRRSEQPCYDTFWTIDDKGVFTEAIQRTITVD